MNHVRIDVLWTLGELSTAPDQWYLYVNHMAMYASPIIRDTFSRGNKPNLALSHDRLLLAQIRGLVEEVRVMLPPIALVQDAGITFTPVGQLDFLTRYPLGQWIGQPHDPGTVTWTRHLKLGSQYLQSGPETGQVPLSELSPNARAAVARLDSLAISTAYRRHGEELAQSSNIDPATLPPPKHAVVFIAYRRSHFDTAKALHSVVASYAHSTAFEPYLDYHAMELGH